MNPAINPDPSQNKDQDPLPFDTCFEDRRKSLALSTHRSSQDVSLPLSLFKLFPQKSPEETEVPSQLNLDTQELKIAREETETFSRSSPSAALTSRMKKPKERYNLSMDLNNSANTEPNKEINDSLSLKEKKSVRFGSVPVSEVGSFLRDSPVHQSGIKRLQSLSKGPRDKDSLSERSDKTLRKSSFGAATLLKKLSINTAPKAPNVSITFDAYVDKHKGERQEMNSFSFPSYKKDKRMEFLGRRFVYPEFIIPEKSKWRKNWNIFIILIILYEVIWYPMSATFFFDWDVPKKLQTVDWLLVMTYAVDIIFNIRTTYCNAESEEIIDDVMIRQNYLRSSYFALDLICVLPISEIMYSFFLKSEGVWYIHHVYSIPKLIRFIRLFKISHYLKNIHLFLVFKIVKTIVPFLLLVHWISCLWYLIIKIQYNADGTTETNWFPNSLRMIAPDPSHLWNYYQDMSYIDIYGFTMLSVFMLMIGSDMAPTSQLQLYFTVLIGMLGVLSFAYVAALVTYIISKRNEKDSQYQQKREELQNKLKVNNIPHNLRDKVMEYFNYTWKKNKIFRNLSDFTELSLPLQRDLAFYLNKNLITNVPLFYELEPIEILSIIHKLKTCIYMPGDKIIRRGERGNEMYFIQEGTVEVVIKIANPDPKSLNPTNYTKVFLEKDNYFGEIALFSNSKRTSDVNAHEFCVLESFSRADYNQLKTDFPDIITRLKAGLRYYKTHRAAKIIAILKRSPFFEDFADYEIQVIVETYMEEIFVDPEKIILRPKNKTNCLYFVFLGNVNSYADNSETRDYLSNLQKINRGEKPGVLDGDEEVLLECLDDELVGDIGAKFMSNSTKKKKLDIVKSFSYGDYFGMVDLDENDTISDHYFLSDSGCQLGAITNSLMEDLALDVPYLYHKLRQNILKHSPKKRMEGAIREEFDSFTVASHRRFSKQGPGQVKITPTARFVEGSRRNSIPTVILEDGVQGFKEQLDKLQSDVDNFKSYFNNIDQKLSQLLGMKNNNEEEKTESKVLVKEQKENRLIEASTKNGKEEEKNKSAPKRSRSMN